MDAGILALVGCFSISGKLQAELLRYCDIHVILLNQRELPPVTDI